MSFNLRSRIRGGESVTVEFKETCPSARKLAKTVCAFTNACGGGIFVGINDRGDIVGVDDVAREKAIIEDALEAVEPRPRVNIQVILHELKDVLIVQIEPIAYPDFACTADEDGDDVVYFRIGPQSRPADRHTEKSIIRLRRHARADRTVSNDGRRILDWLWEKGEQKESACARRLNYGSNRLRKLMERLIGGGYVIPCNIGTGRTYAAIHPGPGRTP